MLLLSLSRCPLALLWVSPSSPIYYHHLLTSFLSLVSLPSAPSPTERTIQIKTTHVVLCLNPISSSLLLSNVLTLPSVSDHQHVPSLSSHHTTLRALYFNHIELCFFMSLCLGCSFCWYSFPSPARLLLTCLFIAAHEKILSHPQGASSAYWPCPSSMCLAQVKHFQIVLWTLYPCVSPH